MARRRKTPSRAQDRAGTRPQTAGGQAPDSLTTDSHEDGPMTVETVHAVDGGDATDPSGSAPAANVHDALLEGVSPTALATASESDGAPAPVVTEPAPATGEASEAEITETSEPETSETETSETETSEPEISASETSERVEDLTVVPEEPPAPVETARETVEAATGAVEAANDVVETVARIVPATLPATLPSTWPATSAEPLPAARSVLEASQATFGKIADLATSPRISEVRISEVLGELGEVNTTVLTYLRGEGAAAVAHWQALSGAKTPADAIRLQVSEMQRAADASLSCFAALAKRASRFTGTIGRR